MPDLGDIQDKLEILEKFSSFYKNPICSDVLLIIEKEKLVAHRFVLAAHSEFFQVLLFGLNFSETNQPEVKIDAPSSAFKLLLQYIYTGTLDIRCQDLSDIADLLELSHRYGLSKLQSQVIDYLNVAVDAENACAVLEVATLIGVENLEEKCWFLVDAIVEGIYDIELDLNFNLLQKFLKRPKVTSEAKLFHQAFKLTQKTNYCTEEQKTELLGKWSFNRMTFSDLMNFVFPTKILKSDILLELIHNESLLKAERIELFSKVEKLCRVIADNNGESLFSTHKEFASHEIRKIENNEASGILIDLGALYRFNHLEFTLNLNNNASYEYLIEVSRAGEDLTKIVDYQKTKCRGVQNLHFHETVARFVRLVGIGSYKSKHFECNAFKVNTCDNPPKSCSGFIFPLNNVAVSAKAFANITNDKHKYKFESQLLNGNYLENDIDTPYTAQKMDDGNLIVEFHQPYMLSSCRFRLWDFDGRKYSYKVETTSDFHEYEIISNKSDELVDGWQSIRFSARPVIRFRITGIKASVGDELRLVHFEAPAQDDN